jgi:hypothetical protein
MDSTQDKTLRRFVREAILTEAIADLGKYEKSTFLSDEDYGTSIRVIWRGFVDSLDHAWQFISAPFKMLFDIGSIAAEGLKSLFSPGKANYQKIVDKRLEKIATKRSEREALASQRKETDTQAVKEVVAHTGSDKNFFPIIDSEISDYLSDVLTAYSLAVSERGGILEIIDLLKLLGNEVTPQELDVKKLLGIQDKPMKNEDVEKINNRLLKTLKYQILPDYTRASLETIRIITAEDILKLSLDESSQDLVNQRYLQAIESI